jgi:hypothetical protein
MVGGWMGARFGPHGYIAVEDARDTVDGLGKRPECSDAQTSGSLTKAAVCHLAFRELLLRKS